MNEHLIAKGDAFQHFVIVLANGGYVRVSSVNTSEYSRVFVVGELFGHFSALNDLLDEVSFSPKSDLLVLTGNLMGYSMASRSACAWLSKPWVRSVAGISDLAVLSRLQGLPALSLIGQWIPHTPKDELKRLHEALIELPLAIELLVDGMVIPVSSRPLPQNCSWLKFKEAIKDRNGSPMELLRGFDGRMPGLQAAGVIPITNPSINTDAFLSISSIQVESPCKAVANIGNRYFMLGSAHMYQGSRYDKACFIPYLELKSLVKKINEGEKCNTGMINMNRDCQLKRNFSINTN